MSARKLAVAVFSFVAVICLLNTVTVVVEGRYLPTRANNDRLDKLKELLKELLESEIEKEEYQPDSPPRWHPESKLFYKRDIPAH